MKKFVVNIGGDSSVIVPPNHDTSDVRPDTEPVTEDVTEMPGFDLEV